MYEDGELIKPELQRKYVWDRIEASRFIESILMGLPVPSIFFAQNGSQKLIVDGYQRIMTVNDYIRGIFTNDGKLFKLSNSEKINARWRNKAFKELSVDEQRKIKSTTIHAIIFEQKQPKDDDTSMYQIFERINTSGRTLTAQEIRNNFIRTMDNAYKLFGDKAVRNYLNGKFTNKFHPAIFDAMSIAILDLQENNSLIDSVTTEKHIEILTNPEFNLAATIRITDVENINKRINIAKDSLGVIPNEN